LQRLSWTLREKYRAILSREKGYYKKVWGNALNVCLAYPHAYRTGMSNLGFQTVYDLFNRHPQVLCERVFLPDPDQEADFRRKTFPFSVWNHNGRSRISILLPFPFLLKMIFPIS
jgi:hypothetical protein